MALPLLRGCVRVPSTFTRLSRLLLSDGIILRRSRKTPTVPPTSVAAAVRPYSSERSGQNQNQKVLVIGIPNPFTWIRNRIYYFLIRAFFDKEFNSEEFVEGAKQAFSHVSRLLSQCQFDALEGLVAKDLIGKLEEKCNSLPLSHKSALSAETDDIMYTTPGDVGIYYDDDDGGKVISILMHFWYLTSARLPDDSLEGTRVFHVAIGGERGAETKRLLSANYQFQRVFKEGVPPDWTITKIEHSKLLN